LIYTTPALRKDEYEQEFINPPISGGSRNKFIQHARLIGWGPEEKMWVEVRSPLAGGL